MSPAKDLPLGYWHVVPASNGWRIANGKRKGPFFANDLVALAECEKRNARWIFDEPKRDRGDAA